MLSQSALQVPCGIASSHMGASLGLVLSVCMRHLLTVCLLIDGEGADYVVCPPGSAEAGAPQHDAERLWETSDTLHDYDIVLQTQTAIINQQIW